MWTENAGSAPGVSNRPGSPKTGGNRGRFQSKRHRWLEICCVCVCTLSGPSGLALLTCAFSGTARRAASTRTRPPHSGLMEHAMKTCALLLLAVLTGAAIVRLSAAQNQLPGVHMSIEEASTLRAAVVIKGNCTNGAACAGAGIGCAPNAANDDCANTSGACGTCNGAVNKTCVADPASPYSCDNALPAAFCCNLTQQCKWVAVVGGMGCRCRDVVGFTAPQNTRTVC